MIRRSGAVNGRLNGKAALITGSTGGIARAVATAFAPQGEKTVVSGRDKASREQA
jgi:NAD(P)-dependent dehydrogenase (short-subunit alcohol dehydrogenase family)